MFIRYKLATRLACAHEGVAGAAPEEGRRPPRRHRRAAPAAPVGSVLRGGFRGLWSPTAGCGSVGADPTGPQGVLVPPSPRLGVTARVREVVGGSGQPSEHDLLHVCRGGGRGRGQRLRVRLRPDLDLTVALLQAVLRGKGSVSKAGPNATHTHAHTNRNSRQKTTRAQRLAVGEDRIPANSSRPSSLSLSPPTHDPAPPRRLPQREGGRGGKRRERRTTRGEE